MGNKEYKKGLWTVEEDRILVQYINTHGKGRWNRLAKMTGLKRCGKSCRLRWMNYLSPSVKHGKFSEEEDDLIIRLHSLLGNRWSLIAGRVPGRTDNQVKNHWNTHLSKRVGVKKAKGNATSTLSRPTEGGGGRNVASASPINGGNGGTDSHQMVIAGHGPREQSMSELRLSSCWFDDELLNWTTPSCWMDSLDGSPLYVPWNEF